MLLQDSHFILNLLDQAIEKVNSCYFIKVKVFLNQFGQKDPDTLELSDLADPSSVRSVSVHMALMIVAKDPDTHVLLGCKTLWVSEAHYFPHWGCMRPQTSRQILTTLGWMSVMT